MNQCLKSSYKTTGVHHCRSLSVAMLLGFMPLSQAELLHSATITQINSQLNSSNWAASNLIDDDPSTRWLSNKQTNDINFIRNADKDAFCFGSAELINYGNDDRSVSRFMLLSTSDGSLDTDTGTAGWTPVVADSSPVGVLDYLSWAQGGRLVSVDSQHNSTTWSAEHINDGDTSSRWLSNKSNNTIEYRFDTDWNGDTGDGVPISEIEILNYGNNDRSVKHFQIEVSSDGTSWQKLEVPGSLAGDEDFVFSRLSNGGSLVAIDSQHNTSSWAAKNIHDGDSNSRWLSNKSNNTLEFSFDPNSNGITAADGDTDDAFTIEKVYLQNYGNDDRSIQEFQVEVKTLANPEWRKLKAPGSVAGEDDYNFLLAANGGKLVGVDSQHNATSWAAANIHDGDTNTRWLSNKGNNTLEFQFDVDGNGVNGEAADLFTIESVYLQNYGADDRAIQQFQVEVKTLSNPDWTKIPVAGSASSESDYNYVLQSNGGRLTQIDSQHNASNWAAEHIHDGDQNSRWLSNKETNTLAFDFDVDFDGSFGDGINLDTVQLINYGADDRAIQNFEIDIQISGGGWQAVNAPGGGTVFTANMSDAGQVWAVGSFSNVTAVRIRTLSNYGDPNFIGAREVIFSGNSQESSNTFIAAMHGDGETFLIDEEDQPADVTDVRLITINNYGDPNYIGAREFRVQGQSVSENATFVAAMHGNGETFQLDVEDIPVDVTDVRLITISNYGDPSYTGAREFEVIGPSVTPAYTFSLPMSTGPHRFVLDAEDQVDNIIAARVITISNHGDVSYTGLREVRLFGEAIGPSYVFEAEMNASTQQYDFTPTTAKVFRFHSLTNHGDSSYTGAAELVLTGDICPAGQWRLDEAAWTGAVDEVIDHTGGGLNGRALGFGSGSDDPHTASDSPALAGSPGTCRYGVFDGVDDYIVVPDSDDLDNTSQLTISAWFKADTFTQSNGTNARGLFSKRPTFTNNVSYGAFFLNGGGNRLYVDINTTNNRFSSNTVFTADTWYHVAIVFDGSKAASERVSLYVNGSLDGTFTESSSVIPDTDSNFYIGNLYTGTSQLKVFDGAIDEVNVIPLALSATEVSSLMNTSRPCAASTVYFDITAERSNPSTCLAEPITIRACQDVGCSALVSDYNGTIDLSVSTAHGGWSINSANGVLSDSDDDDGIARYSFDAANDGGSVVLNLRNTHAETLTLNVEDTAISASGSSGTISFGDNVFVIDRGDDLHVAGRDQPMTAALYTNNGENCAVNTLYTGNKSLKLWLDRDAADPAGAAPSINSEPVPDTSSAVFNLDFNSGVANLNFETSDVGKYIFNIVDDSLTFSDQPIVGDTLIITRPFAFYLQAKGASGEINPGAVDEFGDVFMVAGDPFNVSVRAVAWDSADDADNDGVPDNHDNDSPADNADLSNNASVSSFGLESDGQVETVSVVAYEVGPDLVPSTNVLEDGVSPCSACVANSFSAGEGQTGAVHYANVGIIELQATLTDGNYLGGDTVIGASGYVGRFIPAYFELQSPSITPADTSATAYTYMGQPFLVDYDLVAVNALGQTTDNYKDAYAKLNIDDVGDIGDVGAGVDVAYGAVDLPSTGLSSRISVAVVDPLTEWVNGVLSVIDLSVTLNKGISLDGPFAALALGMVVEDADGVGFESLDLDIDSDGADEVLQLAGSPGELRYGRTFFPPVYGPEVSAGEPLEIPFSNQYWNGTQFVINVDDNTTVYEYWTAQCADADDEDGLICSEAPVSLPDPTHIDPVDVVARFGEEDSNSPITISRPGEGNTGSLNITFEVDDWLQFIWSGGVDSNPTTQVSFGQYRGHDRIIYRREKTN